MAANAELSVFSQHSVAECHIAKLADKDLAAVFKHLPPFERLIVSEVCRKWRILSKTPWRDVTQLDLSQVPTQNIYAVIKKCPRLSSVSTLRQNLGELGRFFARVYYVTSLKCVDCTFTSPCDLQGLPLRIAPLSELIWHGVNDYLRCRIRLPTALKRLQLSGWERRLFVYFQLNNVPQLESLAISFLDLPDDDPQVERLWDFYLFDLHASANLRELYLGSMPPDAFACEELAFSLPQLEILFLNNGDLRRGAPLKRLLLKHPGLRVIVLTASIVPQFVGEHVIPTRKLFPDGFNAEPVPPLHLFLGKIAAERLRFEPSPANALEIFPIDAPLPEFLEKEEVKKIFEGSWIASRIREGAKEGVNLADYSFEGSADSIAYVQS